MQNNKVYLKDLKVVRQENGITQSELAKATGITQQSVALFEQCKTEPRLSTALRLAKYFDVSVESLAGLDEHASLHKRK